MLQVVLGCHPLTDEVITWLVEERALGTSVNTLRVIHQERYMLTLADAEAGK